MLSSEMIAEALLSRAKKIQERAESIAPVGDPETDPHYGRYKASFHTRISYDIHRHRIQAVVYNDSREAIFVEKGTVNQEAQHVLARAMMAAAI